MDVRLAARLMVLAVSTLVFSPLQAAEPTSELPDLKPPAVTTEFLNAQIEAHRKSDFRVVLPTQIAPGTPISYRLKRHEFEFGTAVAARPLGIPRWTKNGYDQPYSAEDINSYNEVLGRYFNSAVAENEMKWSGMEDKEGNLRSGEALLMWERLNSLGLKVRGHNLFWGVPRWLPNWQKEISAEQLEARMKRRLNYALNVFDGKVEEWDVMNELLEKDIFGEKLGINDLGATYFKWTHEIDPELTLYVNEWVGLQNNQMPRYVELVKELQAQGARVGGLGHQSHFFKPIPPSEEVWAMLEQMRPFNLPVKITEFDLDYRDATEEARAADVERFYRICFAHPTVEGIYLWGFWDGRHWRKDAGLWNRDWTPKPAGQAYINLVTKEWHSEGETVVSDAREIAFRGFHGTYELTAGDQTWTVELGRAQPNAQIQN